MGLVNRVNNFRVELGQNIYSFVASTMHLLIFKIFKRGVLTCRENGALPTCFLLQPPFTISAPTIIL